ncbi:hypothetical protein [Bacterioplanoides sp.]|uniref:hypothetical protein n=1 Tax=Bacterioplanoides sp. TaxID=2066072 RepID=UPI003AFF694C
MPIYREGETMNSQNEICEEYYAQPNQHQLSQHQSNQHRFNNPQQPERQSEPQSGLFLVMIAVLFVCVLLASALLVSVSGDTLLKGDSNTSNYSNNPADRRTEPLLNSHEFIQYGTLKAVSYDNYIKNAAELRLRPDNKQQRVWM